MTTVDQAEARPDVYWECPAEWDGVADGVLRDLEQGISAGGEGLPTNLCGADDRPLLLVGGQWNRDARYRITTAFAVCRTPGTPDGRWIRVQFERRAWGITPTAEARLRRPSRTPELLVFGTMSGAFPETAFRDLSDYLRKSDVLVDQSAVQPSPVAHGTMAVMLLQVRDRDVVHDVAWGDQCSVKPFELGVMAGTFLRDNDPVEFLASRQAELDRKLAPGDSP